MATLTVFARGDSNSAKNASLNVVSPNQQPTTQLTFSTDLNNDGDEANDGGDLVFDLNKGTFDPDTVVYVDGATEPIMFTVELYGNLPSSRKLANVGVAGDRLDLRGAEVYVITLETGERLFFLPDFNTADYDAALLRTVMNAFPNGAHTLTNVVVCYVAGTLIATPDGLRAIEELRPGDTVLSDAGNDELVLHVASREVRAAEMRVFSSLRPVTLPAHLLSPGVPERALTVSPLHRILIQDSEVERLFGEKAVFVAARDIPGARAGAMEDTTYFHVVCARHAVLLAEGCPSESLFPGDVALLSLSKSERETVLGLIDDPFQKTAYPCLTSREAGVWAAARQSRSKRSA